MLYITRMTVVRYSPQAVPAYDAKFRIPYKVSAVGFPAVPPFYCSGVSLNNVYNLIQFYITMALKPETHRGHLKCSANVQQHMIFELSKYYF